MAGALVRAALVEAGEIAVTGASEVDQAMTSNPRTAIGIIDSLHYVMAVSDGRTSKSNRLTLYELGVHAKISCCLHLPLGYAPILRRSQKPTPGGREFTDH